MTEQEVSVRLTENTAGGIVFEAACGRQARSGQDCDGWEENG